jgi:hypothetical protein
VIGSIKFVTEKGEDFIHSYAMFLDSKEDLKVISGIKGSGKIDQRTGIEMIDDDTLPEWMLTKNKRTGEVSRDGEGKPYLSMKMVTSLLMGACRELNKKVEKLEKELKKVKSGNSRTSKAPANKRS